MKISYTRALRLSLLALLVCGATAFSARTAQAQWSNAVCADPNDITDSFADFNFAGNAKCTSICKDTGALCRSLVRDSASCNQSSWKGYWSLFAHMECDTQDTSQDRHSCNVEVNAEKDGEHDIINEGRDAGITRCNDDQNQCIMNCSGPV